MSNKEQIGIQFYPILSKSLGGLIETRTIMDGATSTFNTKTKKRVDDLIVKTATAMEHVVNEVNSQFGESHQCEYREQLQSLLDWINDSLPTDTTMYAVEEVVEAVKELLSNAYIKDAE